MEDIKVIVVYNCFRESVGYFHGCDTFFKRDSSYSSYVKQFDSFEEIELSISVDLQKKFIDSFLQDSNKDDDYGFWSNERNLIRRWLGVNRCSNNSLNDLDSYCFDYLKEHNLFKD